MSSTSVSGSRSSSISQQNSASFHYYQDAVRIFVQQVGVVLGDETTTGTDPMTTSTSSINSSGWSSGRRFSVDPQLTNFSILRNLIGRAFDMKGDFAISYRAYDDLGAETYLPLVSDWDLSAAFVSASEPDLQLVIEPKPSTSSTGAQNLNDFDADEDEPWDVVRSTEVADMNVIRDASQNPNNMVAQKTMSSSSSSGLSHSNQQHQNHQQFSNNHQPNHQNFYQRQGSSGGSSSQNPPSSSSSTLSSSKVLSAMSQLGAVNQYSNPISLNSKINTAGIFNTMEKWVQKAKTFVEDLSVVTTRPPLSDIEFRNYLDPGGVLCRPRELRYACYHGGIEPGLRKVVWKHLLNIYPDGLSGNARMEYVRNKSKDYFELRDTWRTAMQEGQISEDIHCVSNMVRKDVLRTDRQLQFFAGQDDNLNIGLLFNILTTFALNHPSVGYCQGMSDLASPLLVTMGDEAQAYICFCSLMERLKPNFNCDGLAMSLKFTHLSETLAFYDPDFWAYLKTIGADDLLFCYRWLLLELKREFAFDDACRMMEVLYASLPYKPQDVPLFEIKFTLSNAHSIPIPVPKNSLTSSYSRVCALRRSSSSGPNNPGGVAQNHSIGAGMPTASELRGRRFSRKPKVNPLSLDENSLTSMSSISSSMMSGSGNNQRSQHTKPFYSLDETMEILSASDFVTSTSSSTCVGGGSPFEILGGVSGSGGIKSPLAKPKKLVKNLKDFWALSSPPPSGGGGSSGGTLVGVVGSRTGNSDQSTDSTPFSSKSSTMSNFEAVLGGTAAEVEPDADGDCNGAVFFDDPHYDSPLTMSTHSLQRLPSSGFDGVGSVTRSRHSSAGGKLSTSAITRNSLTSLNDTTTTTPSSPARMMNLIKSEKSENFLPRKTSESDNNPGIKPAPTDATATTFLPPPMPRQDPEGTSQTSNADSEHDSGHCFGDSMELSLNEPEFSGGGGGRILAPSAAGAASAVAVKMPSPESLGGGNPFLMFLCLTLLLQHRDHILRNGMDYNETAMYFDKLIRKHNVGRVLAHARMLYSEYLKQNVARA